MEQEGAILQIVTALTGRRQGVAGNIAEITQCLKCNGCADARAGEVQGDGQLPNVLCDRGDRYCTVVESHH